MKLDNHFPNKKAKSEIQIQKKQEKERFLFDGVLKPQPNQRVWELDLEKRTVKECKYFVDGETVNYMDVITNYASVKERKIFIRENCDYEIKLNMKNAIEFFRKKYNDPTIDADKESKANLLSKNERTVKKYRNNPDSN